MAEWNFPDRSRAHHDVRPGGRATRTPCTTTRRQAKSSEVGGIVAPPTFIQASAQFNPDYFLRPKIGQPWFGSGKEPTGVQRPERGPRAEGAVAVASGSTPSSTTSTTDRSGPATSSLRPTRRARAGSAPGVRVICSSTRAVTEWHDAEGNLVVTARGVGVQHQPSRRATEEKSD